MGTQQVEDLASELPSTSGGPSNGTSEDFSPPAKILLSENEEDFDLPSLHSPKPPPEKTEFQRDDIVWMKIGKVHMPSVVMSSSKKKKVAKVKVVNALRKEKAFVRKFSQLIDYNDPVRNQALLNKNKSLDPHVETAYNKVYEFMVQRVFEDNISAARYLTYDENDKWYGVTLRDFTAKKDEKQSDSAENAVEDSAENAVEDSAENAVEVKDDHNDNSPEAPDNDIRDDEEVDHEEISSDEGEYRPTDEEVLERRNLCKSVLKMMETEDCYQYLKDIYKGQKASRRHRAFKTRTSNLIYSAGLGPFSDNDLGMDAINIINRHVTRMDRRKRIQKYGKLSDYIFYVMLPEAIIYCFQQIQAITTSEAEDKFYKLSCSSW